MRVALVTSDFPPASGGIAQWAYGVARALSAQGHRVTVFAQAESLRGPRLHEGAPYRVRPIFDYEWRRLRSMWSALANARIASSRRYDVVVATHWAHGNSAVFWSRFYPLKTVVVLHGSEVLRRRNWLERRRFAYTLRNASLVWAVSGAVREKAAELSGVDPARITVIHNGVEVERFHPAPPDRELAARLGLANRRIVVTVARVAERKGHDTVIRALPRVARKCPDVAYLVVGGGKPEQVAHLKSLAAGLGVADRVVFAGSVPNEETARCYNLADVFVLVSRNLPAEGKFEGFGISFLEAGACGKPVIGGRSGGIPEVIEDGRTGFLVNPQREEEVADRIVELLEDPARARTMGSAARGRIERDFTWSGNVRRMLAGLR